MTILEIEGVFNVRDVGGMPANGGRIRSGALLRAGQLSGATTSGAAALRARVQHIVDLRDGEEVAAEPSEIEGPDTTHLPLFLGSVRSFFEADTSLDDLYLHLLEESGNGSRTPSASSPRGSARWCIARSARTARGSPSPSPSPPSAPIGRP